MAHGGRVFFGFDSYDSKNSVRSSAPSFFVPDLVSQCWKRDEGWVKDGKIGALAVD